MIRHRGVLRYVRFVAVVAVSILCFTSAALSGPPYLITSDGRIEHLPPQVEALDELDTVSTIPLKALSYEISMNLAESVSGWYSAAIVMSLRNDGATGMQTITLDAAAYLLQIDTILDLPESTYVDYLHTGDNLIINRDLEPGGTVILAIEYRLTPGTITGPFGAMGLWWNGTRGYTFSFPNGAHAWAPLVDDPGYKATVTWYIGTPEQLTAVANGSLTEDYTLQGVRWQRWVEPNPVCTSEMGLCVADYAVIEAQLTPFPIRYYVYPADSAAAVFDFGRVPEAVALFEEQFGYPYPFSELKIVECGVFNGNGGQEHQTMISLGHNMITGSRTYESIVMHEIAHQWFADFLTPVDWDHFWLNEGFATYSEALWAEHLGGWAAYRSQIGQFQARYLAWEGTHSDALVNSNYQVTMNSPLPYERGALALHQIRMRYGPTDSQAAVAAYLEEYAFGHVASEDLESSLQQITGDPQLSDWFDQWVWRGEVPHFRYSFSPDGSQLYVRQTVNGAQAPEHGLLYDVFNIYYGTQSEPASEVFPWPAGAEVATFDLAQPGLMVFPNYEVPSRLQRINGLEGPLLSVRTRVLSEDVFLDRVLQPGESMLLEIIIANGGLPLPAVNWTVETLAGDMEWPVAQGVLDDIEYLQPSRAMLTLEVWGGTIDTPTWGEYQLRLSGDGAEVEVPLAIALGHPELLLVTDGLPGAADSLLAGLNATSIIYGVADTTIPDLPEDMWGASAVMVEADGRNSQYLFTEQDTPLRNWFVTGGSGSISGVYLDEIYPMANPEWLGGLSGEWSQSIDYQILLGVEEDPIADGRAVVTLEPEGTSTCYPCCGYGEIYWTPDQQYVAGSSLDLDARRVNLGFSLSYLSNQSIVPMKREELAQRIANWVLYRATDLDERSDTALPISFQIASYPNPFNSELRLRFDIPDAGPLRVEIFNLLGQRVALLHDAPVTAGTFQVNWRADGIASGMYVVHGEANGASRWHRVTLLR